MPIIRGYAPVPANIVTCRGCNAILEYWADEMFETYQDTGPYEVDCPRNCIRCPTCKKLIDVPHSARKRPARPPPSEDDL